MEKSLRRRVIGILPINGDNTKMDLIARGKVVKNRTLIDLS
jgi:hypothetical protein